MLTFQEYQSVYNGKLDEETFNDLEHYVCDVVEAYIAGIIPVDNMKPTLDDYGFDVKKAIAYEIDFIQASGGVDIFNGANSTLALTSVSTSNMSYRYKNTKIEYVGNIPIAPLASSFLKMKLEQHGYFSLVVKQCLKCQDY